MPARFDDFLPFFNDKVIAIGPLHSGETVKELCAWVYQPTEDRAHDAAATEMTTNEPTGREAFQELPGQRWMLPLGKISAADFRPGKAFAVAVALLVDIDAPNHERVMWWGQPVDLYESQATTAAGDEKDALTRPPLQNPASEEGVSGP
jgi:hypothetical protein